MKDNPSIFNKEIIIDQIRTYRNNGKNAIQTAGIEVDEILAKEVVIPNTDDRNGVSIIARPSQEIIAEIRRIQRRLQAYEPHQYYYPSQDLHTTILEVVYGKTPAEVKGTIEKIQPALPAIMGDLPAPILEVAGLGFDPKGCAINFVPSDDQLQALRALLKERLVGIGIHLESRYLPTAAHVSFSRYIQPLLTEKNRWADILSRTPIDTQITWKISSLYITWGANWYGNWSQIHSTGPFHLELA